MSTLNHIRNFLRIDDGLATSGMPQPDDFAGCVSGHNRDFDVHRVVSVEIFGPALSVMTFRTPESVLQIG